MTIFDITSFCAVQCSSCFMIDVMANFSLSKRGKRTLIYHGFEFWLNRENNKGETLWRCSKRESSKCKATVRTKNDAVIGNPDPDHTHTGNPANCLARQAMSRMKQHMTENIATPSASQGAVIVALDPHVQMALPKRASVSRVLRRHRQIQTLVNNNSAPLPPIPTDRSFAIPARFLPLVLHDSGASDGNDRIIVLGDQHLVMGLERAQVWLADGTFKVVPTIFFQLYSIHFEHAGGINPPGIYCLMSNKSRLAYDKLTAVLKNLMPAANPQRIVTDFEAAAMNAFQTSYPNSTIGGCYFHLCQSLLRKVNDVGLKTDYETDDAIRGFVRCLAALSHVPCNDVITAFEELLNDMPNDERVQEVVSYFEHTYIRGRRRPGRGTNYGNPIFAIEVWNQFGAAGDGIARTTNSVEGWHYSLQSLFMSHHPNLWTFLTGLERDCHLSRAAYLQSVTGQVAVGRKKYRDLKERVARTVAGYGTVDTPTYLRAIVHLSHE